MKRGGGEWRISQLWSAQTPLKGTYDHYNRTRRHPNETIRKLARLQSLLGAGSLGAPPISRAPRKNKQLTCSSGGSGSVVSWGRDRTLCGNQFGIGAGRQRSVGVAESDGTAIAVATNTTGLASCSDRSHNSDSVLARFCQAAQMPEPLPATIFGECDCRRSIGKQPLASNPCCELDV